MTNRNMSPGLVTETSRPVVQYYELVYIGVGDGYYITNAPWDINYGGNNYISAGALMSFDAVQENIGFEITRLSITIGGIVPMPGDSDPFLKKILSLDYIDRPVSIVRAYYNHDSYIDSVLIYSGYINNGTAGVGLETGAAVRIETSNNWSNFNLVAGRLTNDAKQQSFYPGDRGFEYCKQVQKQVEWKEEA